MKAAPLAEIKEIAWRPYQDSDADGIVALFAEEMGVRFTPEGLRWKYGRNPAGAPLLFELFTGDRLVGHVGGIPQRMWADGREWVAVQSVDILMHSDVRGGSTFLRVLRAYEKAAAEAGMAFMFGFPPAGKLLTYLKKQKFREIAAPTRMVLGLDGAVAVRKGLRSEAAARLTGPLLTAALRRRAAGKARPRPGFEVEAVAECGPEFDELWERARGGAGVTSVRSAEYLNWRFVKNPQYPFRLFAARSGGKLQGFVVLRVAEEEEARVGLVIDLFAAPGGAAAEALVAHAVRHFLEERADMIRAWTADGSEARGAFEKLGFMERDERRTLVAKTYEADLDGDFVADRSRWYFTFGDCDNY